MGALEGHDSTDHVTGGCRDSLGDISVAARQEEGEPDGEGPKHAQAALGLEMMRCHLLSANLCHICTERDPYCYNRFPLSWVLGILFSQELTELFIR